MSSINNSFALSFERPVIDLEKQIKELRSLKPELGISQEVEALEKKVDSLIQEIYSKLSPWERVQLSRHPNRPHGLDYIKNVVTEFHELHGDRKFADDQAIVGGLGKIDGISVAVLAIEKGRKTKEKVHHNFGMPRPEGYRKALRIMQLASRFNLPIVSFVDTPGAYPGIGAEERGQSQAIAENLAEMSDLKVPTLSIVIGEGGSGGALGLAVSDKVMMMEYSVYSVISPESCASILWADPKKAEQAANSLQLGPQKALELRVVDGVIAEPAGGAHRNPDLAFPIVRKAISEQIKDLQKLSVEELLEARYQKFRNLGNQTISL